MSTLSVIFGLLSMILAVTTIYDFFKEPKDIRFFIFSLLISLSTFLVGLTLLITQLTK